MQLFATQMLVRPIMERSYDQFYNPVTNFSQSELMEKFNLAFYEAQTVSKSDIVETFQDFQNPPAASKELHPACETNAEDDYLIDYLISEDSAASPRDCDINFDFNDFVEDFDQNVRDSFSDSTTVVEFDTETFTTEHSRDCEETNVGNNQFSNFFVPPPIAFHSEPSYEDGEACFSIASNPTQPKGDFDNINFCDTLSEGSLDIGEWPTEIHDLDAPNNGYQQQSLPPVGTIIKNNFDFNCYVRNIPEDDMGYFKQVDLRSFSSLSLLKNRVFRARITKASLGI